MSTVEIAFWLFCSLYVLIGVAAVVLNSAVGLTYLLSKTLKETKCYALLFLLSVANIIYAIGFIIAGATRLYHAAENDHTSFNLTRVQCASLNTPLIFGNALQNWITLAVALDRFYAAFFPFSYRLRSDRFIQLMTSSSVVFSVMLTVCAFINDDPFEMLTGCTSSLAMSPLFNIVYSLLALLVPVYSAAVIYLFIVAFRWRSAPSRTSYTDEGEARHQLKQVAFTKSIMSVLLVYLSTVGVGTAMQLVVSLAHLDGVVRTTLEQLAGVFALSYALSNFFMFAVRNDDVRERMKSLHQSVRKSRQDRKKSLALVCGAAERGRSDSPLVFL